MSKPNIGSDPINPAYYAGDACARIIERMPTNAGLAGKYAWRLGEKDDPQQEARKSIWYLNREINLRSNFKLCVFNNPEEAQAFKLKADDLVDQAFKAKKLTVNRAAIMYALIAYTISGQSKHLDRAIKFFGVY